MTSRLPSLVCLFLVASLVRVSADTFVVTNTNDSGAGSLRQAIIDANAHANGSGPDAIHFQIGGSGVRTVVVASAMPEISDPVIIDGWTQPGWNGAPLIELTAPPGLTIDGLLITGGTTTIRGLAMNGFQAAIRINKNGNNTVKGCYLGTDKTGQLAAPNNFGIASLATSGNVIGGPTAAERNIISGNRYNGIAFSENDYRDIKSSGNIIRGNYVGTDLTGTKPLPNGTAGTGNTAGINITSNGARIGGSERGAGNLVSGNTGPGISLVGFTAVIQGNIVGTDITGAIALPNSSTGIHMSSLGGRIGGAAPGERNLVSGNTGTGIVVDSADGLVQGNLVGTDATGKIAIPNARGIAAGGPRNVIGGDGPGEGNLISGNLDSGLSFYTTFSLIFGQQIIIPPYDYVVQGNLIGTDITGTAALPNGGNGISLPVGGFGHQIGGAFSRNGQRD